MSVIKHATLFTLMYAYIQSKRKLRCARNLSNKNACQIVKALSIAKSQTSMRG
jgi:hypothetical protein